MKIDFYELEKVLIIFFGLLMAYAEFKQAKYYRASWTKVALGAMGIYWAIYYAYSIYRSLFGGTLETHQVFVRSGVLMTLALVSAVAVINLRTLKKMK